MRLLERPVTKEDIVYTCKQSASGTFVATVAVVRGTERIVERGRPARKKQLAEQNAAEQLIPRLRALQPNPAGQPADPPAEQLAEHHAERSSTQSSRRSSRSSSRSSSLGEKPAEQLAERFAEKPAEPPERRLAWPPAGQHLEQPAPERSARELADR